MGKADREKTDTDSVIGSDAESKIHGIYRGHHGRRVRP